ncbi:MAG: DUF6436 domain-containing protein [Thalassolituus sp.]
MSGQEHSNRKVFLISSLVIVWLAGSLFGLWYFQQKSIRPFIAQTDSPESRDLTSINRSLEQLLIGAEIDIASPGRATLVHLWNPGCLCNNVSARHTQGVLAAFSEEQLQFVMLAPLTAADEELAEARKLNPRAKIIRLTADDGIPLSASPGLAIFSPSGEMAYYGAYGFGALCSLSDDSLFTSMVATLLAGESYGPFMNVAGSGCFCAWPSPP